MRDSYKKDNNTLKYLRKVSNQNYIADIINRMEVTSVLDIGCYTGTLLGALKASNYKGVYRGVDLAPEILAEAKATYPGADFSIGNALDIDPNTKAECIVLGGVFFYLSNEEGIQVFEDIKKIKSVKYVIYHDIIRCKRWVYSQNSAFDFCEKTTYEIDGGHNSVRKCYIAHM